MMAVSFKAEQYIDLKGRAAYKSLNAAITEALCWNDQSAFKRIEEALSMNSSPQVMARSLMICSMLHDGSRGVEIANALLDEQPYDFSSVNLASWFLTVRGHIARSSGAQNRYIEACGHHELSFGIKATAVASRMQKNGIPEDLLQDRMSIAMKRARKARLNLVGASFQFLKNKNPKPQLLCKLMHSRILPSCADSEECEMAYSDLNGGRLHDGGSIDVCFDQVG